MDIAKVGATQRALLERAKRAAKQENSAQLQINRNNFVQKGIEDNSWMYEAPGLDDEYQKLVDKILTLQEREKNGKITGAESITLRRLNKELLVQKRLKDAATRAKSFEAEEDSLFIPEETKEEAAQRHVRSAPEIFRKESPILSAEDEENVRTEDAELADEMDMNEESTSKKTELEQTKKPRRKPAKDAREFFHRERQDRQNKERQKAQKKRARNSTKTSGQNGKTKSNKATKQGKASLKVNKDMKNMLNDMGVKAVDGKDNIAQMFLDELTSGDQIVDRLTNPFFNTAPGKKIFARRKDTQLQRLLANIPDGSNTKSAATDKEKLRRASMSFGYKMVEAVNGMWLVKGMKSSLHHHQLLGAQWMLSREFGSGEPPFGGLLADAMGLGKTVQTLACMVGNMPQDDDRKRGRGATLIVAPSSVINQWMDEIYVHAKESVFPRIHHYTSSSKMSKAIIESLDIVVTSYTEVMRQIPWPEDKEGRKLLKGIGFEKWLQEFGGQVGVLHQISWYRVVLDEAHAIKNDSARTSKACQNLKSLYKWCLTGTPLMNRLEE
jgi:SNF2 family DNA or RNA helicase